MEVKLRVAEGKNAGRVIQVTRGKFFVGRAEDCHLRPRSDLVSRHHCVILVEEGFAAVRDFGSKNGTFVNGERIRSEQELKSGDRLTVGTLNLEVELAAGGDAAKKPKAEPLDQAALQTVAGATDRTTTGEVNLAEWFGAGEDAASQADTQTVDISDLVSAREFNRPKPADQPHDPSKPKVVGISEGRAKKVTADNSRGAAEDALKKLLRGGR